MKQHNLFGEELEKKDDDKYTSKIQAPLYQPKNKKPHILELVDRMKTIRINTEIDASSVSDEEKYFLRISANRHLVFDYSRIADYYAHATPEMQRLMERSALVIIDFEKAIQY
jgi:hypothetical protein